MHTVAQWSDVFRDAKEFGWNGLNPHHDWKKMIELIQSYISSLNFGYVSDFRGDENKKYINAKGTFVDANTIHCYNPAPGRRRVDKMIKGKNILIAVGGRPSYPNIPGAKELCISSDDLFSMTKPPGKTLVVGASYVALECGGFIHGLGHEVTILVRSIYLRGYDQQIAEKIGEYMISSGIDIKRPATPKSFTKTETGKILATYAYEGHDVSEEYDTVLLAIGREYATHALKLDQAGVLLNPDGSLTVDAQQMTNVNGVYAIGDIIVGAPELTPVAIQTGKLLARRLFGGSKVLMDFNLVPTTVFTPLEYGTVGYSEEAAIAKFGEDNIEVFHSTYQPLEWNPLQNSPRPKNPCYIKLVCLISENMKLIGFHVLGTNAGEITQGFATAMRLGATKEDIDMTVGIHPTSAEYITSLTVTKRSGMDPAGEGGCTT